MISDESTVRQCIASADREVRRTQLPLRLQRLAFAEVRAADSPAPLTCVHMQRAACALCDRMFGQPSLVPRAAQASL